MHSPKQDDFPRVGVETELKYYRNCAMQGLILPKTLKVTVWLSDPAPTELFGRQARAFCPVLFSWIENCPFMLRCTS